MSRPDRPTPSEKDQRKWATLKIQMPRENYEQIREAIDLAKKVGLDVDNDIEALSMMAAEFVATWGPGATAEDARPHRYEGILVRDKYSCQECGRHQMLSVHHIKPKSLGGNDHVHNLITLCIPCHDMIQKEAMKWHGSLTDRAIGNTRQYAMELELQRAGDDPIDAG